jgi:hypothetical protein
MAIPGWSGKFNLFSTLRVHYTPLSACSGTAQSVDAAMPSLYKGANGGGRNPAAAFLWAWPGPVVTIAAAIACFTTASQGRSE